MGGYSDMEENGRIEVDPKTLMLCCTRLDCTRSRSLFDEFLASELMNCFQGRSLQSN